MHITIKLLFCIIISLIPMSVNSQEDRYPHGVRLLATSCENTRRMRCSYQFIIDNPSRKSNRDEKFMMLFYSGADLDENKQDAITRLDQFFNIERSQPAGDGEIGFKSSVRMRIYGSLYQFINIDGMKVSVDITKTSKP